MKKFLFTAAILAGSLTFASTTNDAVEKNSESTNVTSVQKRAPLIKVITSCGEIGYLRPCAGDDLRQVIEDALEIDKDLCG